ncbi:MAG: ribosome biogenesis GTP-binding protein YihA/YsxC [Chitinophagales bacterium]
MCIKSATLITSAYNLQQLPEPSYPEIALVGRSNVGKSSFINRLTNRRALARISGKPGKTRSVNFYLLDQSWYLVDLPGYGYAGVARQERDSWARLIEGFLRERQSIRGLIHLVDIRHPLQENDKVMQEWIGHYNIPCLVVATKSDKLSRGKQIEQIKVLRKNIEPGKKIIAFSAVTGDGLESIIEVLKEWLQD